MRNGKRTDVLLGRRKISKWTGDTSSLEVEERQQSLSRSSVPVTSMHLNQWTPLLILELTRWRIDVLTRETTSRVRTPRLKPTVNELMNINESVRSFSPKSGTTLPWLYVWVVCGAQSELNHFKTLIGLITASFSLPLTPAIDWTTHRQCIARFQVLRTFHGFAVTTIDPLLYVASRPSPFPRNSRSYLYCCAQAISSGIYGCSRIHGMFSVVPLTVSQFRPYKTSQDIPYIPYESATASLNFEGCYRVVCIVTVWLHSRCTIMDSLKKKRLHSLSIAAVAELQPLGVLTSLCDLDVQ